MHYSASLPANPIDIESTSSINCAIKIVKKQSISKSSSWNDRKIVKYKRKTKKREEEEEENLQKPLLIPKTRVRCCRTQLAVWTSDKYAADVNILMWKGQPHKGRGSNLSLYDLFLWDAPAENTEKTGPKRPGSGPRNTTAKKFVSPKKRRFHPPPKKGGEKKRKKLESRVKWQVRPVCPCVRRGLTDSQGNPLSFRWFQQQQQRAYSRRCPAAPVTPNCVISTLSIFEPPCPLEEMFQLSYRIGSSLCIADTTGVCLCSPFRVHANHFSSYSLLSMLIVDYKEKR